MKTKKLFFYMFAVILGGCIPVISLHPLYTEKDVVVDKKLCGTWADDANSPTTWEFKCIDEPKNAYKLIFTDEDGKKGSFVAHLVKLQNRLFLDIFPSELPWEPEDPNKMDWPYNSIFLIPAHTFVKIDSIEPQLKLRLMLESNMEELLKEKPDAVEHTSVGDRIVLTGSTKELQTFILKYADDKRVFTDQVTLSRKEPKTETP
ncbi:MAG: hypothetical protein A2168_05805 [Planctomycetes bacterium RBG_13_50_24]|nr:MAG: hypothetical protein A2168_05805 [Planctomycetes bacterium RBG_13_50_24]